MGKIKSNFKFIFILAPLLIVLHFIILFLSTGFFWNYQSYFVIAPDGESFEVDFVSEKPKNWITLNEIGPSVKWSTIFSEDWSFYDHEGIDYKQLGIALEESWKEKKLSRGASTITQQVVKNLFLSSERSLTRKINEYILTVLLEKMSNKKWILEQYFNLAQYGDKLYGVKPAAYFYFKKPPSNLSYREAAFLAMLLPSPKRYSQSFRQKQLTNFARRQVGHILDKLVIGHIITKEQRDVEKYRYYAWEKVPVAIESTDPSDLPMDEMDDVEETMIKTEEKSIEQSVDREVEKTLETNSATEEIPENEKNAIDQVIEKSTTSPQEQDTSPPSPSLPD